MSTSDEAFSGLLSCLGAIALIPLVLVITYLINGWVLTILWGWFIVPIFHLPALTLIPALGLGIVAGYLTYQTPPDVETVKRGSWERMFVTVGGALIQPLITLVVAWIIHWMM